jgi:4-amino-4-deoxy-L-arabinose transferase-like glycosyltransferase
VIRGALRLGRLLGVTGDGSGAALMPVMRSAAVLMGVCSGLLSLLLARRMFRDDRAALAVIVLSAAVPMFAVGSLLITIDAPMYLCWAGTVYCLWRAVERRGRMAGGAEVGSGGGSGWLWLAGLVCALGMLFKPVLIALPLCVLVGMAADGGLRRAFKTWHAAGGLLLVVLSQVPVVVWNAAHGWVTFRHILTQGGMGRQAGPAAKSTWYAPLARIGEYLGGQVGGMGGIMFVLLAIGVVVAWQKVRRGEGTGGAVAEEGGGGGGDMGGSAHRRTRWVFLLSFTVPLWGFYFVMNLWKRTEVNWPAASYFTGMILLAGVFVERWNSPEARERRGWRQWGTIAVAWGFLMTAVAMNTHRLYPLIAKKLEPLKGTAAYEKSWLYPRRWDQPTVRLRGLRDQAEEAERVRQEMKAETGQDPLIITTRYGTSSSLSFYMPGHPFAYCIMSSVGERQNQYDLWPGLNEKGAGGEKGGAALMNAGKPAVLVGPISKEAMEKVVRPAFERVGEPEKIPVEFAGVKVRELVIYRAYGFRGLPEAKGDTY